MIFIENNSLNQTPVKNIQFMLREINLYNNILPEVIVDGIYDNQTKEAVMDFQKRHSLAPTGVVDLETFEMIVEEYNKTLKNPIGL